MLIVGVTGYGWYVMEIATLFFGMGIASGIAMNYHANIITKHFLDGVKDILSAAMVVGRRPRGGHYAQAQPIYRSLSGGLFEKGSREIRVHHGRNLRRLFRVQPQSQPRLGSTAATGRDRRSAGP